MFKEEIYPRLKMDMEKLIREEFEYKEGNYMGIPACLSDHEVFYLDGKVNFGEFGWDENPEYVMFLEGCKNGAFGPYQVFDFIAFDSTELKKVSEINGVFSYDELSCMEAFEHWDDEEGCE